MKFTVNVEQLLKPLQLVAGGVERKQTMPILSNILLEAQKNRLTLVTTDLEVELTGSVTEDLTIDDAGSVTVSARKLVDICKNLPLESELKITQKEDQLLIQSGKSRFKLVTLPANKFPRLEGEEAKCSFKLSQDQLKMMLQKVYFSMAEEDVRHYLNGLTFIFSDKMVKLIAADGHRLSLALSESLLESTPKIKKMIMPYKAVRNLLRLLGNESGNIHIALNDRYISIETNDFKMISKLIDAKVPDYEKIMPRIEEFKPLLVNRELFRQTLLRASVLTNEKHRGIRVQILPKLIKLAANNPEQEVADEEIAVEYDGNKLETGFNVNYLIDVCNAMTTEQLRLAFTEKGGALVEGVGDEGKYLYFIMPLYL